MNFMSENEFILLMNYNNTVITDATHVPTLDERKALHDAGISTAIEYPRWRGIEPSKGVYDFTSIETILELNRGADTKTILSMCGSENPAWIPDEWLARQKDGKVRREVLSLWNEEAQEYLHNYYEMLFERFCASDVLFILGEYMEGEAILPCEPSFYDDYALEDYKKWCGSNDVPDVDNIDTKLWLAGTVCSLFVEKQRMFYAQEHKEIWNMQQWLLNEWSRATINYAQPQLMEAYRDTYPDASIVLLQYSYYDKSHPQENTDWVNEIVKISGCEVIVEAHFCDGLKWTTPKAIAEGFRGQIVCPVHVHAGSGVVDSWKVEEIRKSVEIWRQNREDSGTH